MIERVVILPLEDNTGKSNHKTIELIERELIGLVGGFSSSLQTGKWLDQASGKIYEDTSLRITITTDVPTDEFIETRLPLWCSLLGQVELYTHTTTVHSRLVKPTSLQAIA